MIQRLKRLLGLLAATVVFVLPSAPVQGAFGVLSSGGEHVVDTGAGLVFRVDQSNGDITSINSNAALPPAQWPEAAQGSSDGAGNFALTNSVGIGGMQQFYLIEIP